MKRTFILISMLCIIGITNKAKAQEVKINHDGTNGLVIESTGTLRMDGTAEVWDDLRVTLDKGSSSATLATMPGIGGPQIWYFKWDGGLESMSFTAQLPHNWKEGTKIYPHIHWAPEETGSGNVVWNLDYSWQNYVDPGTAIFPAATTVTNTSTGSFTQNTHIITALTPGDVGLDATGKTISSILVCRIWRNGSIGGDTYNGDAGLLFLDFHYQLDTFGSREKFTK